MSLTFRAVTAGFALLTVSFNQASSESDQSLMVSIPKQDIDEPEATETTASQEEVVQSAVKDFRTSFEARVRSNDRSGTWDKCYSSINQNYDPRIIPGLRQAVPGRSSQIAQTLLASQEKAEPFNVSYFTSFNSQAAKAAQELQITKPIVVIDFGHGQRYRGGYETGANEHGVHEARVADAVGRQLTRILQDEYGLIVVNTRSALNEVDGFDLGSTTRFRNQDKSLQIRGETLAYLDERFPDVPKAFISVHTNRAVGVDGNILPDVSGGLVFSYSPSENGRSGSAESQSLARHIASNYSLRKRTHARTNDYAVLRCQYQNTAAVLLELGFNTNPSDRAIFQNILSDNGVAYKYAANIAKGIGAYFDEREKKKPLVQTQLAMNTP